jgi:serine/threonine protein kinase
MVEGLENARGSLSSSKVDCPSEDELLARVAGGLSPERAEIVDAHIDACAECRVLLAEAALWQDEPRDRASAAAAFAPGELIADRYRVTRWLATGGMGEVFEVHDTWLDERIALKTIVASIADDVLSLARLKAEVRLARRVTHANVCRVYDLGFHQRRGEQIAFLTMELLRGTTLRARLREAGRFDFTTASPLIAQLVDALAHAHGAGIVHRDFKSDNVMLVPGQDGGPDRAVVMDFGLARQSLVGESQPLTPHSRAVFGTLDYMSPEQVMGRPASPASDIYSLGVVIYELLSGRLPFEGESPLARAVARVTQKAPALVDVLPGIDPAINACIAKCLETKGDRRFGSVHEVLRALPGDIRATRRQHMRVRAVASAMLCFAFGVAAATIPRDREPLHGRVPAAPTPMKEASRRQLTTSASAAPPPKPLPVVEPIPRPTEPRRPPLTRSGHHSLAAREPDASNAPPTQRNAAPRATDDVPVPPPGGDALLDPFPR